MMFTKKKILLHCLFWLPGKTTKVINVENDACGKKRVHW